VEVLDNQDSKDNKENLGSKDQQDQGDSLVLQASQVQLEPWVLQVPVAQWVLLEVMDR